MKPSRESLLDLIEKTYEARYPDIELIREQYEEIIGRSPEDEIQRDATVLMAGLNATQHTYEDRDELSDHEKLKALRAIRRIQTFTRSILNKYGVEVA